MPPDHEDMPTAPGKVALARSLLAIARQRQLMGGELVPVADPAWHMLLELYVARAETRPVSVSSVCIASFAPPTTALRHLDGLLDKGLVNRAADSTDRRRTNVDLTGQAVSIVSRSLSKPVSRG